MLPVRCAQLLSTAVSKVSTDTFLITPTTANSPPAVLPAQRSVFAAVPKKPPGLRNAALLLLEDVSKVLKPAVGESPLIQVPEQVAFKPFAHKPLTFSLRPLQRLVFDTRQLVHQSIILLMDGLLFACFRLRLERDVCAIDISSSCCEAFGAGESPASTFCGLYMPSPTLLRAVLLAVKMERGYGIFVGLESSDDWSLVCLPNSTQEKATLLLFTFAGPDGAKWKGIFCSFAYQGKVKRKKNDAVFDLKPILQQHLPSKIGAIPFCPARVSLHPHAPTPLDDTAKRSPSLGLAVGIPCPKQSLVWSVAEMSKLAALFPHSDVAQLFTKAVSPQGASLRFVGDRTKRVVAANGALEPDMVSQIRDRFMSKVSKNRMMGPFERCPFPNDWCPHQPRSTPLDTRRKDKYDPLSTRFRVISNFSAGHQSSINALIYSPKLLSTHLQCAHLRDALFLLGPNARFDAIDQEDAFRADHINLEDAHLYCYQVGNEWFIDLRDPFGNIKSEYTYALVVAVLKFGFECDLNIVRW